jgi:hypothetical protein
MTTATVKKIEAEAAAAGVSTKARRIEGTTKWEMCVSHEGVDSSWETRPGSLRWSIGVVASMQRQA